MDKLSSPQSVIEKKMIEISEMGNYDMVRLFSNKGQQTVDVQKQN